MDWRLESRGTHQKRVRLGFSFLHFGVVSQNGMVEQSEQVFVSTRFHFKRHSGWTGGHRDGNVVLLQVSDQPLNS